MQTANQKENYLHLFRKGEETGFTHYFETFYPAMLFYAFRLVKNKVVAETIVEETFIALWEKHGLFETEQQIRTVLYNKIARQSRAWICQHGNGLAKQMESSEAHLPDLIRAEVTRKLYAAIRELPPFYKQVFRLLYIQGKSLKEVSEELNISESTLRDHQLIGLQYVKRNEQMV